VSRLAPLRLCAYVVTSQGLWPGRGHHDVALAALEGGADAIQLRCPELDDTALLSLARTLLPACASRGALLIVDNRLAVAIVAEVSGVHLGQDDPLAVARQRLGPDRILGVSVATAKQAAAAAEFGADYLGVTVWPTATKPGATAVGVKGLRRIVAATALPVVAIGGITPARVPGILDAGAAGVAVVSAVGAAPDPVAATRALVTAVRRRCLAQAGQT
jgi:thiamine-phosphate pyrophosphorylase